MNSENKLDFRYKTKGILLFLVLVSILSIIPNFFLDINFFSSDIYNRQLYYNIYNTIDSSLYRDRINNNYRNKIEYLDKNYFNFYIKAEKVTNYPMTEEYMENYPQNIVGRTRSGAYSYYNSLEEAKNAQKLDGLVAINKINPEEPIVGVSYLSNDDDFSNRYSDEFEFDPTKLIYKNSYTTITGSWDNTSIRLNPVMNSDLNESQSEFLNTMIAAIKENYNSISQSESGIKSIDFAYIVDLNSSELNNLVETSKFITTFAPKTFFSIMVTMAVISIFAILTNYQKSKDVGFYKAISSFPIEVVIILIALWFIPLILGLETNSYFVRNNFQLIFGTVQIILMFFGGIAILYLVNGFKSIYNEGAKSYVVKNSIFTKIATKLWNFIKNNILNYTNNLDGTNKNTILITYFTLMFIGFMGTRMFVSISYENLVFILWFILITGVFIYFNKYYKSILEIESISKYIADGNYNKKIDEINTRFPTLSHSLNTISENLDNAVAEAIKSERMKTELITNVSHDLKTPLTSIINYSELIVESDVSEEERIEYAKVINEKSHRLKSLIEGLFEVSKIGSNNIDLNLEKLDLGQLVEQAIGEWEDKLNEKNLDVKMKIPTNPVFVTLDGIQTSRILENILSNVYKYAQDNTRVYVDMFENENIELIVKNISKYPLNITTDELMERFKRGDESRSTEGSGLGLSISQSLTEIQGGKFNIEIDGDLFKVSISFSNN